MVLKIGGSTAFDEETWRVPPASPFFIRAGPTVKSSLWGVLRCSRHQLQLLRGWRLGLNLFWLSWISGSVYHQFLCTILISRSSDLSGSDLGLFENGVYIYYNIIYIYINYIYSLISQKNISIGRMMINHWILGYTVFRQTHFICPVLSRSIRIQKTCPLCPLFLGHHFASQSSSERKLWLRALSNLKARCWWTWVGCGDSNRNDLNLR